MANKSKKSVNIDAFEKKIKHTFGTKILER